MSEETPEARAERLLAEIGNDPRHQVVLLASRIPGVKSVTIEMADGQTFRAERT